MTTTALPAATTVDDPMTPVGERLAETAGRLFYARGIRAVGVELIAEEAGTTKKTLYDRFGSKDALVALYLRRRAEHLADTSCSTGSPGSREPGAGPGAARVRRPRRLARRSSGAGARSSTPTPRSAAPTTPGCRWCAPRRTGCGGCSSPWSRRPGTTTRTGSAASCTCSTRERWCMLTAGDDPRRAGARARGRRPAARLTQADRARQAARSRGRRLERTRSRRPARRRPGAP